MRNIFSGRITAESIKTAAAVKGRVIQNIRTLNPSDDEWAPGLFVIDFRDGSSISITAVLKKMVLDEIGDELAILSCGELSPELAARRLYDQKINPLRVEKVTITTDHIRISDARKNAAELEIDHTISFCSEKHKITFSLDPQYDTEWIRMMKDKDPEIFMSIDDVKEAWGDGVNNVVIEINRSKRSI